MSYLPPQTIESQLWTPNQAYGQLGIDSPMIIQETRAMRDQANHYAGRHVGAVAVGMTNEGQMGLFRGANQNLYPGPNPTKVCAEQVALQKMINFDFDRLLAMFVSGPVQADTQSGEQFETLHSCGVDRDIMSGLKAVRDDSLMVFIHPDQAKFEMYRFDELLGLHNEGGYLPISFRHYEDPEFDKWKRGAALFNLVSTGLLLDVGIEYEDEADKFRAAVTGQLEHHLERQGKYII